MDIQLAAYMVEEEFGGLGIPGLVNLCMISSLISRYISLKLLFYGNKM
jgi:hypothetical protein